MVTIGVRILAMLSLFVIASMVQQPAPVIKLTILHDGKEKASPSMVAMAFKERAVDIAVREGSFEVRPEIVNSERFTLIVNMEKERIQIPDVPNVALQSEFWTIHLAEERYSDDFQFAVPKDTVIPESCIIAFTSIHHEGWSMTARKCRSERK